METPTRRHVLMAGGTLRGAALVGRWLLHDVCSFHFKTRRLIWPMILIYKVRPAPDIQYIDYQLQKH